jgi:hypothetical protein
LKAFGKRVLRRISRTKREEVAGGGWIRLHNEELHNLCTSPSIIKVIKSRRMSWVGHAVRMAEMKNTFRILVGKPEEKRHFGRYRSQWKFRNKWGMRVKTGLNWLRLGLSDGFL